MSTIPRDLKYNLLLRCDYDTIITMCHTDHSYYLICQDSYFWHLKIQQLRRNFNPNPKVFPISRLKKFYRSLEGAGSVYKFNTISDELSPLGNLKNIISIDSHINWMIYFVTRIMCLDVSGKVYGSNAGLYDDLEMGDDVPLKEIPELSNIVQVAAGATFTLFLDEQGDVYAADQVAPFATGKIQKLSDIKYISAGTFDNFYVIDSDNDTYSITLKSSQEIDTITPIDKVSNIIQIDDSLTKQLILDQEGKLYTSEPIFGPIAHPVSGWDHIAEFGPIINNYVACISKDRMAYILDLKNDSLTPLGLKVVQASGTNDQTLFVTEQGTVYTYQYTEPKIIVGLNNVTQSTVAGKNTFLLIIKKKISKNN